MEAESLLLVLELNHLAGLAMLVNMFVDDYLRSM